MRNHSRTSPVSARRAFIALASLTLLLCASVFAQVRDAAQATLRGNRTLVIAHRGGASEMTENTIAAFLRAARLGADGIETDLHLTRDGRIVLYHDDYFGRVEGLPQPHRTRRISDMTYPELTSQPLDPVGEDAGGSRVPTIQDLFGEVRTVLLNIEIKRDSRFKELVEKTIVALKGFTDLDRVVLEPPDLKTAQQLRKALGPRLKLQINPSFYGDAMFQDSLKRILKFKPHSISVSHKKLSAEIVSAAHTAGVEVWVYTVNEPDVARALLLLGVDAIKTDRPTMLLSVTSDK